MSNTYSIQQVASYSKLSTKTIYRAIWNGSIKADFIKGKWHITEEEFYNFIMDRQVAREVRKRIRNSNKEFSYSAKEVAALLQVSTKTMYKKLNEGKFPGEKHGRKWYINASDVHRLIALSHVKTIASQNGWTFLEPYTSEEAAEFLEVSLKTYYKYCREGKIKAVKVGKRWITLRQFIIKCMIEQVNHSLDRALSL